jgi:hypothetical protein
MTTSEVLDMMAEEILSLRADLTETRQDLSETQQLVAALLNEVGPESQRPVQEAMQEFKERERQIDEARVDYYSRWIDEK